MVLLAAKVWDVTVPSAIKRLHIEGVKFPGKLVTDIQIDKLAVNYDRHRSISEMWQTAQKYLVDGKSPVIKYLRAKLHLHTTMSRARLIKGPAQLFGAMTYEAAKHLVAPNHHGKSTIYDTPFRGGHWSDLLFIPYFSSPDRICAFQWIGRHGTPNDFVYHAICASNCPRSTREFGLAGADAVIREPSQFVIGVPDAALMLRLQMRHMNMSLKPLPMVAWYSGKAGKTQNAWEMFSGRQIVIWDRELSAKAILQCYRADADLVIRGPHKDTESAWNDFIKLCSSQDLVQSLCDSARPWREVVRSWLKRASQHQVTDLLSEFNVEKVDPIALFQECEIDLGLDKVSDVRRARVDGKSYIQRGNQWFYQDARRRERLVLNATVRIDAIIHRQAHTEYRGEVVTDSKTFPYKKVVPHRENQCIQTESLIMPAIRQGVRLVSKYRAPLIDLACAFHMPDIVRGKTKIGWDGKAFRFKSYSIKSGQLRGHPDYLYPDKSPGLPKEYLEFNRDQLDAASQVSIEDEVNWAIMTSVLACITGPFDDRPGPGVILSGPSLDALSCVIADRLGFGAKHPLERDTGQRKLAWRHNWPVRILSCNSFPKPSLVAWLNSSAIPWNFCTAHEVYAYASLCNSNNVVVNCQYMLRNKHLAEFPHLRLTIGYLRYRTRNRQKLSSWDDIHRDLIDWMESLGCNTVSLRACRHWVTFPDDADVFQKTLAAMYRKRVINVKPDENGLTVTRDQIVAAYRRLALQHHDLSDIEQVFVPKVLLD